MGRGGQNSDVQIRITATDDASGTLEKTARAVDGVGKSAADVRSGLSSLGREALSAASTGRVNFEGMAMALAGMIPVAGAVAGAIVAVGAAAGAAANTAAGWWKQVDDFADVTGMSIGVASEFVTGMEMAGASSQRMGLGVAMLTQRLDDEARAAAAAGEKTSGFGRQLARIEEDHTERVADAAERVTEQIADLGERRVELTRDHTRRIAALEHDLFTAQRAADLDRLERAKDIARQYADIDLEAGDERKAILSQFANADTELGKRALAAELAALDERTETKKSRIADEERDRNEAAGRELQMRQQAIQEQIALEREAYAERMQEFEKMQARILEASEKAAEREAKSYARQVEDIQAAAASAGAATASAANSTAAALERLGINVDDFKKANVPRQIQMIVDGLNDIQGADDALATQLEQSGAPKSMIDAMRQAKGETDKAKGAMELFGKYGAGEWLDFARVIEIEGWGGMEDAARSYGTYIGDEFADDAESFVLAQNKANLALKGAATTIGAQTMPAFESLSRVMAAIASGNWSQAAELTKENRRASGVYTWMDIMQDAVNAPGRALGGPVESGMPYIVGERGPELFVPRQGGQVVNHTWNYSPTYGAPPSNEPQSSFAIMRAMGGYAVP